MHSILMSGQMDSALNGQQLKFLGMKTNHSRDFKNVRGEGP